ncbi:N-acetylmuramoyl-L-alanine amidase [Metabacillus sp. RGM 3146]|uniref:N-acetylmuramoyl-L-alanine amidase n=1 Tax=Metabacillus sp. RGM 3146 TaxID=3401092 RepID=UPI003B9D48D9
MASFFKKTAVKEIGEGIQIKLQKWVIAVCLVVFSLLPIQPQAASAAENMPFIGETQKQAAIHRGATAEYRVVKTISASDTVLVIDQFTNQQNEKWYRVVHQGVTGWVNSVNVKMQTKAEPFMFAAGTTAEILKGAEKNTYPVKEKLEQNALVQVLGTFINKKYNQIWYNVQTPNSKGWIPLEELQKKPNTYSGYVSKLGLEVRKGAEASYKSVHKLTANEKVTIIDYITNSNSEPWYRLELASGTKGWVEADKLSLLKSAKPSEPAKPEEPAKPQDLEKKVYAKLSPTIIHSGAETRYRVVYQAPVNFELPSISEFINKYNEKWLRVEYVPGKFGWVKEQDTSTERALSSIYYVQSSGANVRKGAETSYPKIAALNYGSAVKVVDQFTNKAGELWYRIKLNATTFGWISASLLSEKAIPLNEGRYVGTYQAELRTGAGYNNTFLEKLRFGSKVTAMGETINDAGEKWVNITSENGKIGWVPEWEVYQSLSDRQYVYAKSSSTVYKSASASSKAAASVKSGETLTVLRPMNNWLNVETSKGTRGWIETAKTGTFIPTALTNPVIAATSRTDTELRFTKTKSFNLSYKLLSDRSLQLNTSGIQVDLPSSSIKGIKSISNSGSSLIVTPEPGYLFTVRDKSNQLMITVLPTGLKGKKIILDAGHGGKDSGAIGPTKLYEKTVNLAVIKYLGDLLEKNGASVIYTRDDDTFLELYERTDISNASDADMFISVHQNSSTSKSVRGSEVYFNTAYNFNGAKSQELSKIISASLTNQIGTYNRGTNTANFYVLKHNELPSVLVELAFISNPTEESWLRSDSVRRSAAQGIYNGVEKYFTGGY